MEEERTEQEQTEQDIEDLDVSEEQSEDVRGGLGGRHRPEDRPTR